MANIEKCFYNEVTDDIRFIREKVFVEEQGFQDEFDEIDKRAFHLVLFNDGKAVANGRVFKNTQKDGVYTIGRVAVLKEYRKHHFGSRIMEFLEEKSKAEGAVRVEVSAQCSAQNFYKKNGYIASGAVYLDQFCPHIHMEKTL